MLLVLFVVTTVQSTLIYFTPLGLLVLFVFLVLFCRYYKFVTPLVLLVLFVLFRRYYGSAHTQLHHPLLLFVLFIASTVLSTLNYSNPSCFWCFFVATTFLSTLNYSTPSCFWYFSCFFVVYNIILSQIFVVGCPALLLLVLFMLFVLFCHEPTVRPPPSQVCCITFQPPPTPHSHSTTKHNYIIV